MALFMVLFSISSVNMSKFEALQQSLQDAFSGKILPGGKSIQQTGADSELGPAGRDPADPGDPGDDAAARRGRIRARPAAKENEDFKSLKQQIDAYAKAHGLDDKLQTTVARRGLVVRLLTDKVLFDPGVAAWSSRPSILGEVSHAISIDKIHPIMVEGHTDSVPSRGPSSRATGAVQGAGLGGRALHDQRRYRQVPARRGGVRVPLSGRLQCHGGRAI